MSEKAIAQIADETNELWFSVASIWEIRSLGITAFHALQASALPLHHRDPFDQMLIAQAQIENMILVSANTIFKQYSNISLLWAANS